MLSSSSPLQSLRPSTSLVWPLDLEISQLVPPASLQLGQHVARPDLTATHKQRRQHQLVTVPVFCSISHVDGFRCTSQQR